MPLTMILLIYDLRALAVVCDAGGPIAATRLDRRGRRCSGHGLFVQRPDRGVSRCLIFLCALDYQARECNPRLGMNMALGVDGPGTRLFFALGS